MVPTDQRQPRHDQGAAPLTCEKIVAAVADQFICIIDNTKTVDVLGTFPCRWK